MGRVGEARKQQETEQAGDRRRSRVPAQTQAGGRREAEREAERESFACRCPHRSFALAALSASCLLALSASNLFRSRSSFSLAWCAFAAAALASASRALASAALASARAVAAAALASARAVAAAALASSALRLARSSSSRFRSRSCVAQGADRRDRGGRARARGWHRL